MKSTDHIYNFIKLSAYEGKFCPALVYLRFSGKYCKTTVRMALVQLEAAGKVSRISKGVWKIK